MILAKSCHDTDILQWLVGKKCKRVQSFGSLSHFTHENRPKGAPDRCTDGCPYADTCFYNAVEFYQRDYIREIGWADVAADEKGATNEKVLEALKTGPYGRCVYACDNDVVDHQVVNFEFEDGCTASFTMSAFNEGGRNIRIFGTKGELTASMSTNEIEIFSFDTLTKTVYQLDKVGEHIGSGHGGGDFGIMRDVINYFGGISQSKSISDIRTSYLNHIIAFAAEVSRLEGTVIDIDEFSNNIEI
jgi:predicted dehydrogenase